MVRVVLTFMVLGTWAFSPDSRLRQQLRRQTQETSVFPSTVFSAVSFSSFQFAKSCHSLGCQSCSRAGPGDLPKRCPFSGGCLR